MSAMKFRSLFISHSWSYGGACEELVALLDAAPHFQYQHYSVPKNDSVHSAENIEALYDAIKNKMLLCNVVLIMAGMDAIYNKWILREIKIATKDFCKPIVAVRRWRHEKVSPVVPLAADKLVDWNTESIVSAIREVDP
jgi:hypothetical protein